MTLSKDEFVKAIEDIQNTYGFQKSLLSCYNKYNIEGNIVQPDCSGTALRLLHNIYSEKDRADWIDTFCYDLDFGKKWKPGTVRDNHGKEVKLENAEDLYNLLVGGDA